MNCTMLSPAPINHHQLQTMGGRSIFQEIRYKYGYDAGKDLHS